MSPQVPVVVIAGIDQQALRSASDVAQCALPQAVVVHHELDPERDVLHRLIFDITGVIDDEEIFLDHACTACATREDVIPTLERLAASGSWPAIIAQLPVTSEPMQICRVLGLDSNPAPHARVGSVITAVAGLTLGEDTLGADNLTDRELPVRDDDPRGVGEVLAAMIEYGDLVSVWGETTDAELTLTQTLARPGVGILRDFELPDESLLLGTHDLEATEAWASPIRREDVDLSVSDEIWVLDLRSDRPFHPGRLMENLEALANWPVRSRGCFWLPTRPDQACQWDGSGGDLSLGSVPTWEGGEPLTRIVFVGGGEGRDEIAQAFEKCLLTDLELAKRGQLWEEFNDGFEPWLGPIHQLLEVS